MGVSLGRYGFGDTRGFLVNLHGWMIRFIPRRRIRITNERNFSIVYPQEKAELNYLGHIESGTDREKQQAMKCHGDTNLLYCIRCVYYPEDGPHKHPRNAVQALWTSKMTSSSSLHVTIYVHLFHSEDRENPRYTQSFLTYRCLATAIPASHPIRHQVNRPSSCVSGV